MPTTIHFINADTYATDSDKRLRVVAGQPLYDFTGTLLSETTTGSDMVTTGLLDGTDGSYAVLVSIASLYGDLVARPTWVQCQQGTIVAAGTPMPTGPDITLLTASNITQTGATISWTLSEFGTGQVEYGLTTAYGGTTAKESSLQYYTHSQSITGLTPGTLYHFRVKSTNAAGYTATSPDTTFTTASVSPPPSGPTISAVTATNITQTSATISWSLSEKATGQVEYGLTSSYGNTTTLESSFNYQAHAQSMTGLTPGTLYHYRVKSQNAAGALSVSPDTTFTTTAPPNGPVISSVAVTNITQTGATVSWSLSEKATGQVEYGTTTSYGKASTLESSLTYQAHAQQLSGLTAGTLYHYRVKSTNAGGYQSVSSDGTFTTAGASAGPPPAPTNVMVTIGDRAVGLTWQ